MASVASKSIGSWYASHFFGRIRNLTAFTMTLARFILKGEPLSTPLTLPTHALFSWGCCETMAAQFWRKPPTAHFGCGGWDFQTFLGRDLKVEMNHACYVHASRHISDSFRRGNHCPPPNPCQHAHSFHGGAAKRWLHSSGASPSEGHQGCESRSFLAGS